MELSILGKIGKAVSVPKPDGVSDHSSIVFLKGLVDFVVLQTLEVQRIVEHSHVLVLCRIP